MRIRFLTSTPLEIARGSGTYAGISLLGRSLAALGHRVVLDGPGFSSPIYTLTRFAYNRSLRPQPGYDLTVGFDMDGYTIANGPHHVAALKGVIADEVRFERGLTRFTMGLQAKAESVHVRRAERVIVTSRYSAARAQEFYGLRAAPLVVPEMIDLGAWRALLEANPRQAERFTVLSVGRFYRRKRIGTLLRAAGLLKSRVPELEVRIVGDGPCASSWHALARVLSLGDTVTWLGSVSRSQLAAEYNRASVFCLPSVQEGFGIVLLEAMAAGVPIVASRAAAIPETVPFAELVEPDQPEALAQALLGLYESSEARARIAQAGLALVEQYEAARIAQRFLDAAMGQT